MVPDDMMNRLIDNGKCYIMDINVENTEVMNISRQSFLVQMMVEQKNRRMQNISNL